MERKKEDRVKLAKGLAYVCKTRAPRWGGGSSKKEKEGGIV